MPIRKLLVLLFGGAADEPALKAALGIAALSAAHIEALFMRPSGAGLEGWDTGWLPPWILARQSGSAEQASLLASEAARRNFETWRDRAGVSAPDRPGPLSTPTAAWREDVGHVSLILRRRGQCADLIVVQRQDRPDWPATDALFEAALMTTGRPVLLVPYAHGAVRARTVAVAWKPTAQASRALAGALPLLAGAERVELVSVEERHAGRPGNTADVAEYLAWRGVAASLRPAKPGPDSAGHAILREAAAIGADLLVMGAYTHSWTREELFGGATRHVVDHASLPVLFAH
jgi:nucleotide-binding universal stress UspA family protein